MGSKKKRFEKIYEQYTEVIIKDVETGVLYYSREFGRGVALTPLLDKDGKPIIEDIEDIE